MSLLDPRIEALFCFGYSVLEDGPNCLWYIAVLGYFTLKLEQFKSLPVKSGFAHAELMIYMFIVYIYMFDQLCTERFIRYRKIILKITQPSQYRYTQLQFRCAVISKASSINIIFMKNH